MNKKKNVMLALVFVIIHAIHTADGQDSWNVKDASYCQFSSTHPDGRFHYCYYSADGILLESVISNRPYALLDPKAPLPKIATCSFSRKFAPGQVKRNPHLTLQAGSIEFKNAQGKVVLSLCYNPLNGLLSDKNRVGTYVTLVLSNSKILKDQSFGKLLGLDVSELDFTEFNTDIANWHRDYEASNPAGVLHRMCTIS